MADISKETMDAAKELAPWRSGLSWVVVLIEGIVLGGVGLLVLIDVQQANKNVALIFTVALAFAGILQLWAVVRHRAPENIDSALSARAAIAVFAGLSILLLYFLDMLTVEVGLIIVGLASLIYGLIGLILVFRRRVGLIEAIFFTIVGLLMIYTQVAGSMAVTTTVNIIGWLALIFGIGLIIFAFLRRNQGKNAGATGEKATSPVNDKDEVKSTVEEAANDVDEMANDNDIEAKAAAGDDHPG